MKKALCSMQPIGPGDFAGMPSFPPVISLGPSLAEADGSAPMPMPGSRQQCGTEQIPARRTLAEAIAEARTQRARQHEASASTTPADSACGICRDSGFLVADVPYGHADFGKLIPCSCNKPKHTLRDTLHRISDLALPGSLDMTFESFNLNGISTVMTTTYSHAKTFAKHPQGNFVLLGGYGTGKTHLATAIAHVRYAAGDRVLLKTWAGMLNLLRASFRDDAEGYDYRLQRIVTADMLVIDDLGAERMTEWAEEQLFLIINERVTAKRPMVITSNQRPDMLDQRITSRVQRNLFRNRLYLMLGTDYAFGKVENLPDWYAMADVNDQWLQELDVFARGEGEGM